MQNTKEIDFSTTATKLKFCFIFTEVALNISPNRRKTPFMILVTLKKIIASLYLAKKLNHELCDLHISARLKCLSTPCSSVQTLKK